MAQFFNFEKDYYGLSEHEVEKRLSLYGLNTYSGKTESFAYWEVLLSPAVLLMFIAGVLCFFNLQIAQGIAAILIDGAYVFAEIYFRQSSDKRLKEIEDSTSIKFRVIRNGRLELVDKEKIVPEDTIVVQEGERVPADAFIQESIDLTVDESIFTGDPTPVPKYVGAISKNELKQTFVYEGTTVLSGMAVCQVSATAVDTKLYQQKGDIPDRHPYFTSVEKIMRGIVPIAGCVAVAMTLVSLILSIVSENDIIPAAIDAVTIGICFIPTGISAVIRAFYTRCAMKMVKNGAIVKSFHDIEKLNSLSVLCVEKEGAISKNRLEVRGIFARSEELLYKVAALSCEPDSQDAYINALMVKAAFFDEDIKDVYTENNFVEKIPDSGEMFSGAIWEVDGDRLCCIRGIPEQILPMCRLNGEHLLEIRRKYEDYYSRGCSVIAVACVEANSRVMDVTAGFSYMFIGLAAFSAPLRDSVSSAVKTCKRAGVRVVMLTEENPEVAESTGKMIGLNGNTVVTGKQIAAAEENGTPIDLSADIYAKISPAQKLYVIDKLREKGEVVAMTGTRSSDAEVLEAANVGITISQLSVGSTLEASDIIMNDDNFSAIADMIFSARRLHRNIKLSVSILISGYIALAVMMIINLFSKVPLMPTPSLAGLLIMVFFPLLSIGFIDDRAESAYLPPSEFIAQRKINYRFLGGAGLFGLLTGLPAIASYLFMYNGSNSEFARSCGLITFCFGISGFTVLRHLDTKAPREFLKASGIAKISAAATAVLPILLVYIPFVNRAFRLAAIDILALLICIVTGILPVVAYYFIKNIFKLRELL